MYKWFLISLVAVAATPALAGTSSSATPANPERILSETVPAQGLHLLKLTAGVGEITVHAGSTQQIHIRVVLSPKHHVHFLFNWSVSGSTEPNPAKAKLDIARDNGILSVRLLHAGDQTSPQRAGAGIHIDTTGTLKEHWLVTVPPTLAAQLVMAVGDVHVRGLGGGLHIKLGVGRATVHVSQGPLDMKVGVGHAVAYVKSSKVGHAVISTGIGHAHLDLNGHAIKPKHSGYVSETVDYHGSSGPDYQLDVGTGDAVLHVGTTGGSQ